MPRQPMNYQNTVIYKIVCNDLNVKDVYVGHTTNFIKRKYSHKSTSTNSSGRDYDIKIYTLIRANGGWDNWRMIEIEKYPCSDFNEASARERYWYENLEANLNCKVPNRSKIEYNKVYEINNIDKINNRKIKYRQNNREKVRQREKKYEEDNKEKISQRKQIYYQQNKAKIKNQYEERKHIVNKSFKCECGGNYVNKSKQRHLKSLKHQNYIINSILPLQNQMDSENPENHV